MYRRKLLLMNEISFQIYCGYVDDSRNTDNAWMETRVINYHDETGEITKKMKLVSFVVQLLTEVVGSCRDFCKVPLLRMTNLIF